MEGSGSSIPAPSIVTNKVHYGIFEYLALDLTEMGQIAPPDCRYGPF
jgi:hypothetical protein